MSVHAAETIQKTAQTVGYTFAGVFAGMTLTDWDLILRIAVGVVSFISISIHIYFKIRAERRKNGT